MNRFATCLSFLLAPALALAGNNAEPAADPVLEHPTLHSLGVYWIVKGDDNQNAAVTIEYRKSGESEWHKGYPLFRVERGAHKPEKGESKVVVPADGWLFAGSLLLLNPDTSYEMKLHLKDPDGGDVEKTLTAKTIAEPLAPADARVRHVVPGDGGGSGTQADPFKGLAAAQASAQPGDLFLVHAGVYKGTFTITKFGQSGKPIIWRGAGDGETILDGAPTRNDEKRAPRMISVCDAHDVWFEKLTIRNADWGIVAHDSGHIVVRRCHIHDCDYGFTATRDSKGVNNDDFLCDNTIEGPCKWPRSKGIEDPRGIQIAGAGHVVCYNRVTGFSDAIDTFQGQRCEAIDFHNNEVSELTDDGFEMDYSQRNTRNFYNRMTNVFQGISLQPIYGGPTYVFRNVMYNVGMEAFKLHNSPSGAIVFHNTCVKLEMPLMLQTNEKARHIIFRNNLFIGTEANYCYENNAPMENCDFDYDGFGGGPFKMFLKWNKQRYATLDEVKAKAPVYKHAVMVDPATAFASGVKQPEDPKKQYPVAPDLRLSPKSAAVDAGEPLPGLNDGYAGKAPDLGAYELGQPLPHYGPRPEAK